MRENYQAFHARSINDPEAFWAEQAQLIHWQTPFTHTLEYDNPPFRQWFVGGETNLCYNAVDRHLAERADQNALIAISTETNTEVAYTYQTLYEEVCRMAAIFKRLGVGKGDRVLIYMPMIPQALFAMLATVRLGAIHAVVFGGFASHSLATRIEDTAPKLIVTADAGMRGGKVVKYKPLLDKAIELSSNKPEHVLIVNRGLDEEMDIVQMRDMDYAVLRSKYLDERPECVWVESNHPSYILYTSGTTGKPKGVQRDTGGYTVALASTMKHIYCGNAGETFFCTSDIGWVVGHSYIVYAPLIAGMATVVYEGLPTRPDPGVWWQIVEKYRVSVMFSAPTALRVLKKQDPAYLKKYDTSSLRGLYMAGEPLDEPTSTWISQEIGVPIYDNYWQTETGWPILSAMPGVEKTPLKSGSPSFPVYGYNVKILNDASGEEVAAGEKGVVVVLPPLPPGNLTTIWGQDQRFIDTYFSSFSNKLAYSTSDWGIRDEDGYYFILGRTDDVINVAGHRLGTREIEEAVSGHSAIAEVAVVGVHDALKGQVPVAFAVVKNPDDLHDPERREALAKEVIAKVGSELGAIANPSQVHFVAQLPKTRSGKVLRRSIQAIAEGRDPGDLTTLDDIAGIEQIKTAMHEKY